MRSKFPKYPFYKRVDESSSVSATYNRVQQQQPQQSLVLCVYVCEGRSIEACEGGNRLKTIEQKRGGGEKA
jgi:hypothetical protein